MVSLLKASFTKRKSNFTYSETDLLLEELEKNKDLLSSAAGSSKHRKRAMWDDITLKINNIGEGDERTMEEVRKKWSDMQCLAKRKYCKGKQELNEFEVRVLALRSEAEKWTFGSFLEENEDCNFEFDTLSETDVQIKQEKTDYELDHPPVHFDGNGDYDQTEDYPETSIPFDSSSRKRKSNFSVLERNMLLEEVKRKRSIIMSKSNDTCTHEKKRLAWEEITDRVNNKGRGSYRTVEEVRKKWNDMQSLARRKKRRKAANAARRSQEGIVNESFQEGEYHEYGAGLDDMHIDGNEEASMSFEGTEDGNSIDHNDIMERVMASAYAEEADHEEIDLIEDEEEPEDSNDSNCSEWTPGSRRKLSASSAKPRKGNFSTSETNVLLDEIYKRRRIIFSPNLDRRTAEKKRREWGNIAQFVSEICNKERRTLNEVRKKWSDLYTRASKFKIKREATETDELSFESDIDKINNRVLFIMEQKDEEQRKQDDEFEVSMFGRNEEEEGSIGNIENDDENSKPDKNQAPCSPADNDETNDLDSGIIIVQVQGGHKKGTEKVVDVINLKKEASSTRGADNSALVIENVSTIDEKIFSSMDNNEVSTESTEGRSNSHHGNQAALGHRSLLKSNHSSQNAKAESGSTNSDLKASHAEQFIFRKRKGKFSSRETLFLLEEVKKHKSLLLSKLTATAINEKKKRIWQEITDKLNQLRTGVPRSIEEVKKKWYDLQCNAKKKRALQESLLERMKMTRSGNDESGEMEDGEKSKSPHFFRSHSKLLSLLGPGAVQSDPDKSDMAVQADCDDSNEADDNMNDAESDEKIVTEENSNSNDEGRQPCISISTDKIRDNIKTAPNILTNTDWKVLEITDGRLSEIANYAAIDHNYEVRLDKYSETVGASENQTGGLRIESVVSQAETLNPRKSTLKKEESEDTASTLSHITADIAHQRLSVERRRLAVEKRRLKIEQEKLRLLRRLVKLEEKKAMMKREEKAVMTREEEKKGKLKDEKKETTEETKDEEEKKSEGDEKIEGEERVEEGEEEEEEEKTEENKALQYLQCD